MVRAKRVVLRYLVTERLLSGMVRISYSPGSQPASRESLFFQVFTQSILHYEKGRDLALSSVQVSTRVSPRWSWARASATGGGGRGATGAERDGSGEGRASVLWEKE